MTTFESLGLAEHLLQSTREAGFLAPTPIQLAAIPVIAAGDDLAAEAQTGSGKTAAFVLPILQRLGQASWSALRVLTLAPTRELALQVAGVFRSLSRRSPRSIDVLAVIGGEPIERQIAELREGVQVVVATPGRLLDLARRGELDLGDLEVLVLDEADRLLDLGFAQQLAELLPLLPEQRQTLLFSATLPQRVLELSAEVLREPVAVRVDEAPVGPSGIRQRVIEVDRDRRRGLLQHLLEAEDWGQTLVFVASQRATENLSAKLRKSGLRAGALHGGLDQADRVAVLSRFQRGGIQLLVATDIAARGIDVPRLGAVLNFDLPRSKRDYLHRIGRTGRAGASGLAVSFVDHASAAHFRLIEEHAQVQLPRERIPGFELTGEPVGRSKGSAPNKGRRKSKKDRLREQAARRAAEHPGTGSTS